jgi:hypothetical protein
VTLYHVYWGGVVLTPLNNFNKHDPQHLTEWEASYQDYTYRVSIFFDPRTTTRRQGSFFTRGVQNHSRKRETALNWRFHRDASSFDEAYDAAKSAKDYVEFALDTALDWSLRRFEPLGQLAFPFDLKTILYVK